MSSVFLWGAFFGLLTRASACRASMIPFTTSAWKYPKYMLIGGVVFHYADWYRRLCLEQLCVNEEKQHRYQIRAQLQQLKVGEELTDAFRDAFYEHTVLKNTI